MNKIYIVTSGNYEDYGINACFSTKAKAQEFIKHMRNKLGREDFDIFFENPQIEEWNVDEE